MDPAMSSLPSVDFDKLNNLYPQLELRLMHQWTAHTSQVSQPFPASMTR